MAFSTTRYDAVAHQLDGRVVSLVHYGTWCPSGASAAGAEPGLLAWVEGGRRIFEGDPGQSGDERSTSYRDVFAR